MANRMINKNPVLFKTVTLIYVCVSLKWTYINELIGYRYLVLLTQSAKL